MHSVWDVIRKEAPTLSFPPSSLFPNYKKKTCMHCVSNFPSGSSCSAGRPSHRLEAGLSSVQRRTICLASIRLESNPSHLFRSSQVKATRLILIITTGTRNAA